MKRAAIYLRVSTLQQDYERQRHEIEDFCRKNDYEIVKVFEEKASGAKDERPEFNELCELTKDDIDVVIVWEISRLGRKLTTLIKTIEDFKDKGINVISLKERFELFDSNGRVNPSSMIMMSLFSTMAVIERENIIERSMSGKIDKLRDGKLAYADKPPFGYKKENKQLVIDDEKAEIVRQIYKEYIGGLSQAKIAKMHKLTISQVQKMLSNPVYCGKPFSNVLKKALQSPQIVSVDTYTIAREKCEQRASKRAKIGSYTYSLRCKIFCVECNHVLVNKKEYFGCHCGKTAIQTKFINIANEMVLNEVKNERASSSDTTAMNEKLESLRERHISLRKLMAETKHQLGDAISKVDVLKEIFTADKLKKEIAEVKRLEKELEGYDRDLVHIKLDIMKVKSALKMDVQTMFIDDIVDRVNVFIPNRSSKRLEYHLVDGTIYNVIVKTREHKYEIIKGSNQ